MHGIHDMGGMQGAGPIVQEQDEPVFHEQWEKKVFTLMLSTRSQGLYNIDEYRHGIERMNWAHYLVASYHERSLSSMETLLTEKGIISREELAARVKQVKENPEQFASAPSSSKGPSQLKAAPRNAGSTKQESGKPPRFKLGDKVVTRNIHSVGHTRLPGYILSKQGVVEMVHGAFILPDTNAHGKGENPEPVYSIKFDAREVWGEQAAARDSIYVDLWESYLAPAS